MMHMAPIFSEEQFTFGDSCKQYRSSNSFVAMGDYLRNFGASPPVSAGNGTGEDDDNRMQVDPIKKSKCKGKGKHPNSKKQIAQAIQATLTSTPARHVVVRDTG